MFHVKLLVQSDTSFIQCLTPMLPAQTKFIEADSITFGPRKGGMAELHDSEAAVQQLLTSGRYSNYSLDDWSLGVELTSYLCLPRDAAEHSIDFVIQVHY